MQVRVYNKNTYPLIQPWNGETIRIEPNQFVVMEEGEAVRFKGAFLPPKKLGTGQPDPMSFKILEIVPHTVQPVSMKKAEVFVCHFDGMEFDTQEELDKWIDENHLDKLADQEYADKRRKGKAKQ